MASAVLQLSTTGWEKKERDVESWEGNKIPPKQSFSVACLFFMAVLIHTYIQKLSVWS